jgi:hypothetical protein
MSDTPCPSRAEQNADVYQPLLKKLALLAAAIAERAGELALARVAPSPSPPASAPPASTPADPDPLTTFERASRLVRQCAALANKIETDLRQSAPALRPRANPAARRMPPDGAAVRTRVQRAIYANAEPERAEDLLAGLYDRLEEPEILQMLARHGIEATVAALCTELGVAEPVTNLTDEELAAWIERLDPVEGEPDDITPCPRPPTANSQAPPAMPPLRDALRTFRSA